jgi:hypothetical protein
MFSTAFCFTWILFSSYFKKITKNVCFFILFFFASSLHLDKKNKKKYFISSLFIFLDYFLVLLCFLLPFGF